MKVNPVRQFVINNISRFEREGNSKFGMSKIFNLYDKNNAYRGEYFLKHLSCCEYTGVKRAMSATRIMDDNLNMALQEIVYMNKDYVTLKDKNSDVLTKVIPSEITIITTVLDYVNDMFETVRRTSRLKNELQRIDKNDPDFIFSDRYIIYKPLKEKPKYENDEEVINKGSISEIKKDNPQMAWTTRYSPIGTTSQVPFRYW